ncbi:uncharacterized protein LOC144649903 [Oculina patagonica]
MAKRYVPPGARHKETAAATTKNAEDSQRSLDDIVQDAGGDVFEVNLRSKNKHNLPFAEVSDKENSDSSIQKFEFQFNYKELRTLMSKFREIGWKDQDAVLQFPATLEKTQRKQVHEIAQSFGLGTSSSGFGETRYISVYSVEKATLGVGKVNLTKQERDKANVIWRLVKQQVEDEKYKKFSHNEIEEMVLANKLDPLLQELWEKRESLLVDDFAEKCKVSEK